MLPPTEDWAGKNAVFWQWASANLYDDFVSAGSQSHLKKSGSLYEGRTWTPWHCWEFKERGISLNRELDETKVPLFIQRSLSSGRRLSYKEGCCIWESCCIPVALAYIWTAKKSISYFTLKQPHYVRFSLFPGLLSEWGSSFFPRQNRGAVVCIVDFRGYCPEAVRLGPCQPGSSAQGFLPCSSIAALASDISTLLDSPGWFLRRDGSPLITTPSQPAFCRFALWRYLPKTWKTQLGA